MKIRIHSDVIVGIVMLVLGVAMFTMALGFPETSRRFPFIATGLFTLFAIMIFGKGIQKSKVLDKSYVMPYKCSTIKYPLLMFLLLCGYCLLIEIFTFFPATAVFLIGIMLFGEVRSKKTILIYTVVLNLFIWLLFVKQFKMMLP